MFRVIGRFWRYNARVPRRKSSCACGQYRYDLRVLAMFLAAAELAAATPPKERN